MNSIIKKCLYFGALIALAAWLSACGSTEGGDGSATLPVDNADTGTETVAETLSEAEAETENDGAVMVTFDGTNIRKDIVDYMKSMALIPWTPSEDFSLNGDHNTWGVDLNFKKGGAYLGLPYTRAFSDLDGFAKHVEDGVYKGPCGDYNTMPGNNCSSSCDTSWRRYLISTTEATYTYVPGYNNKTIMPVGSYTYPENNRDTAKIIAENGREAMFEAYALCRPADAIVKWLDSRTAGHARMVSEDAVVVRNNSGKINGSRSYLKVVEQTNKLTSSQGKQSTWLVDKVYTFNELCDDSYVPVTPTVFADGKTETPFISYTDGNTADNIAASLMGTVESNYRISTLEMTVTDGDGKVVKEYVLEVDLGTSKINLRKYTFNLDIKSLPAGKYGYKLVAHTPCLGSAELCSLDFVKA